MFKSREYITLDNLTGKELENILAYLNVNDPNLFGMTGKRFITVDVRYSGYLERMYFKLTVPRAWIKQLSEAATLDMIRQGMVE